MKILHIIDSGGLYGAEMVLLNLVAEQIKLGLDPTIASIGEKHIPEKPIETEALKRGFRVEKFRMRPGPNYLGAMKILHFGHKADFDIMHSHGYKGNILFGLMPRKIRKIPMVSTIHGWTNTNNGFSKMKLYEWLDSKSLRYIDAVVLVSNAMKSHPRLKNLNGIKFHVVPNGIPIPETQFDDSTIEQFNQSPTQLTQSTTAVKQPLARLPCSSERWCRGEICEVTAPRISLDQQTQQTQETQSTQQTQATENLDSEILDFCSKGFTIGSIGRLSYEKGYRYLIEALYLLIKKGVDARLIIIGEGNERDFLKDLALQFDLNDRVVLPGYRDGAKKYLPYFKVFVISSLTEGLPITLLEAMQAKIPIVATSVGGIPETLDNGQAGFLVKPGLSLALGEVFHEIARGGKNVEQFVTKALERVTAVYNARTMSLGYLELYNQLLDC